LIIEELAVELFVTEHLNGSAQNKNVDEVACK
jgi:hypothetical protein